MVNISVLIIILFCINDDKNEAEAENHSETPDKKDFSPDMPEREMLKNVPYYFKEYTKYFFLQFPTFERREVALATFIENLHKLHKLNKRNSTAKFKVNEYTIFTLEKFKSMYTGFRDVTDMDEGQMIYDFNIKITDLPSSIDFRDIFVHNFAVDQGECKSSYVFSTIGNIEAQVMKNFHFYPNLSLQFAYECEPTGDCFQGGLPHLVMEALMKTPGIVETPNYANYYHSAKRKKCKINEEIAIIKVTGVYRFRVKKEEYLTHALALYGPLVIAIYVGEEIKNYRSGVLEPLHCKGKPDHAVLLSGYGDTEDGIPYWIIKNSWGPDWGENGFFRMIRRRWACGIGSYIVTATVDINYENNMTVTPIILPQKDNSRSITLPIPEDTEEVTEVNNINNFGSTLFDSHISDTKTYSDKADITENLKSEVEPIYLDNSSPIQRSIDLVTEPKIESTKMSTKKLHKLKQNTHSVPILSTSNKKHVPEHKKITRFQQKMHDSAAKHILDKNVKLKLIVNKDDYTDLRLKDMGKIAPHHIDEVIVLESTEVKVDVTDRKKIHTSFQQTPKDKDSKLSKATESHYVKTLTKHTIAPQKIKLYTMDDLEKETTHITVYVGTVKNQLRKKTKSVYTKNTTPFFKKTTEIKNIIRWRQNKSSITIKTTFTDKNKYFNTKNTRQNNHQFYHKGYVPERNSNKKSTRCSEITHYSLTNMHKRSSTPNHKKYLLMVEDDDSAGNVDNTEYLTTKSAELMNKEDGEGNDKSETIFRNHNKHKSTRPMTKKNYDEDNKGDENNEFEATEQ